MAILDSPRAWYVAFWVAMLMLAVLLAHVVVVRPITTRLDALVAAMDKVTK